MSYFGNTDWFVEVAKGNIPSHELVHKFGRNSAVANGSWELVANLSAAYPFPTAATTVRVAAGGDAADTSAGAGARTIIVEGLDDSLARATETITLAGASASSSTSTSFWRVDRAYVETCGTYATPYNTGAIVIEDTAGANNLLRMEAEESQTQLCQYALATGYTAYILVLSAGVDASKPADIRLRTRANLNDTSAPLSPIRLRHYADGVQGDYFFRHATPDALVSGPADIWVEAQGSGAGTEVSANMEMLIVAD